MSTQHQLLSFLCSTYKLNLASYPPPEDLLRDPHSCSKLQGLALAIISRQCRQPARQRTKGASTGHTCSNAVCTAEAAVMHRCGTCLLLEANTLQHTGSVCPVQQKRTQKLCFVPRLFPAAP